MADDALYRDNTDGIDNARLWRTAPAEDVLHIAFHRKDAEAIALGKMLDTYDGNMTIAFWSCAIVTAASAGVSFSFAAVGLRSAKADVKTGLMYAFARSLSLLAVGMVALFTNSIPFVSAVAVAMIIVQAADAIIGIKIHDRIKTVGPAVTGAINLVLLIWLLAR